LYSKETLTILAYWEREKQRLREAVFLTPVTHQARSRPLVSGVASAKVLG
jgi:hypothetical protein